MRQVRDVLGEPSLVGENVWRFPWLAAVCDIRNTHGQESWEKAWHGCKFEALRAILLAGELDESNDKSNGERFFADAPGVYLWRDAMRSMVDSYN